MQSFSGNQGRLVQNKLGSNTAAMCLHDEETRSTECRVLQTTQLIGYISQVIAVIRQVGQPEIFLLSYIYIVRCVVCVCVRVCFLRPSFRVYIHVS